MFDLHLQNIAVNCCFTIFVILNINHVLSETHMPQNEFPGDTEDCVERFNKSESYSLKIKGDCSIYYLNLNFIDYKSIINLTTSIQYLSQDEDWVKNSKDFESTFDITWHESTRNIDTTKESQVLLKEWHENSTTIPFERSHLSRSSEVLIAISGTGNWEHYEIKFSFSEIKYRLIPLEPKSENEAVAYYNPNSVSLLRLNEPQMLRRGIKVWFDNLTIDTEMGEYVLIGAGSVPFKNEHSRPLYITEIKENSTFFVANSSAFIAFVSGSTENMNVNKDFKIMWKWIEKEEDELPEDQFDVLKSSLICFYNYSAAIEEFKKEKNRRFELFRQHFSEIAKAYLSKEHKNIDLNKESIDLFGASTKETVDSSPILSMLVKVRYKGISMFTWKQLQDIIEKSEENITHILGYKVGRCPQKAQYDSPYKDEWSFVIYALVPVFGLFALMMWAWKQKLFAQNCLTEKEEKLSFGYVQAEPNAYATTTPKVCIYDEEGRRETLIQSTLLQEDRECAKDTSSVEMNAIPSTSQEQDTLTRYLSSRKRKSRPSIQPLLNNVEEINKRSHPNKTKGLESDHLYDSLSSSKQLHETKL